MSLKRMAKKSIIGLLIVILTAQGWLMGLLGVENTAYAAVDLTTLGVAATLPVAGEKNVNGAAPLEIEFDQPIRKATGTTSGYISIKRMADDSEVIPPILVDAAESSNVSITPDNSSVPDVGKKVTINHTPLPGGTYYIQIDKNAFVYTDENNTAFNGLNKEWTFHTQGVGTASLVEKVPANAAMQVSPSSNITMTFDKKVFAGAGKLQIFQGTTLFEEIPVNAGSPRITGLGTTTIVIDPEKNWNSSSTYYVVMPEGLLRDELGNDTRGITGTEWGFGVISDPTALTVSSISPTNGTTNAPLTGELTVTFNKELDTNYPGNATLRKANGGTVAVTTTINNSNNRQLRIVPQSTLESNTNYYVDIPANVFRDKAGNLFTGLTGTSSWGFKTLSRDTTAPVLKTVKMYSNNTIRLTYDESLFSANPAYSSFTVTVNGEARNVSTAYVSGDTVYVVLDTGVAVGQVVRIGYTPGLRPIQDTSMNPAASFAARDVENTLDSVMSKPREGTVYYSTINLYYPETVYINSSDAVSQFSVTANQSSVGINSISLTNSSMVTLNLSRVITDGEVVRVSYAPGSSPVKDSRGQALAGFSGFYVRNSIDTKAPEFQSAEVSGSKLWIRYNEPLRTTNKPLKSQYSVLVDGKPLFVNDTDIEDDTVTLTLASAVGTNQNVTLSYVPGALRLTDLNGNPAGYINLTPVSYTAGNGMVKSATLQGDTVTITFRESLQSQTLLTPSQFGVQLGGSQVSVVSATSSGTTLTLKLASSATSGQTGTISYSPGVIPLRTLQNVIVEAFGPLSLSQTQSTGSTTNTGSLSGNLPSWLTVSDTSAFNQSMYVMSTDAATTSSAQSRNSRSTRQFNVDASKLNQAFQYANLSNNSSRMVVFEVPSTESAAYVGFPIDTLTEIATRERFAFIGVKYGDRLWSVPLSDLSPSNIGQSISATSGSGTSYLYVQLESVPITMSSTMDGMLASAGAQRVSDITDVYLSAYNGYSGQRAEQKIKSQLALRLPSTTSGANTGLVYIDQGTSSLANIPHMFTNALGAVMVRGQLSGNQTVVAASHQVVYRDTMSHWAKDVISELSAKWIINGQNGTLYVPEQKITRAEFATLVAKGLGLPGDYSSVQQFKDVRYGDPTGAYIGAAAKAGIITGNTDGTFRPDSMITREQMAIMMVRALDYAKQPTVLNTSAASTLSKFKDSNRIQSKELVAKAVQEGIIQGMTTQTFVPTGSATRAQAAVMLKRVLNKLNYL
ncbi:SwmB domain-containing protein [Paenibacillus taichungensis]